VRTYREIPMRLKPLMDPMRIQLLVLVATFGACQDTHTGGLPIEKSQPDAGGA
jgi:hypothetical protein